MITNVSGSSTYFKGGVIAYDNQIKMSVLGVSENSLNQFGAVSHQVAQEMAQGVQKCLKTDWSISITGIAGPDGGTPDKPVGLVYIGIASPDGQVTSQEYRLGDERGRNLIRHFTTCYGLDQLRRKLINC